MLTTSTLQTNQTEPKLALSLSLLNEKERNPTPPGQNQVRYQLPTGTPPYSVAESWFGAKIGVGNSQHDQKTDILRPRYVLFRSMPSSNEGGQDYPEREKRKKRKRKENRIIHCAEITFFLIAH